MDHSTRVLHDWFKAGFSQNDTAAGGGERRIGAELKFPLVTDIGTAAPPRAADALWRYLGQRGWRQVRDKVTGRTIGARKPGAQNDTVASCETGYCKPEFSLAHVGDLHALAEQVRELRDLLADFTRMHGARFLGYGIQPLTPPSRDLFIKKERSSVWDKACPSNRQIPAGSGDDVHLFTINAACHVHVSVSPEEAIPAVNVLNGFAPAQIALTANSSVWKGEVEPGCKCVGERLWDWWAPAEGRAGMPAEPFSGLADYIARIENLKPIYVERESGPVILRDYASFAEYFTSVTARGYGLDGSRVTLVPTPGDVDLHNSCYWYNARISRYYTVENRACDEQPPDELISVPALTLGLVSALGDAWGELRRYDWRELRQARLAACERGLQGRTGSIELPRLCRRMLQIAELGLQRRGRGEERYLECLQDRLRRKVSPADEAAALVHEGGIAALVAARTI